MSRDLGMRFGVHLEPYRLGLAAVEAEARDRVERDRRDQEQRRSLLESRETAERSRVEQAKRSMADMELALARRTEEREKAPTQYSLPRGLFFVVTAILLLVGDFAILAGVLAQLLELDFRKQITVGNTVAIVNPGEIVNYPWLAFREFRSLTILTMAVLLLGFFPKLVFDFYRERATRAYRWSLHVVLAVSIACVMVTALARFYFEVGQNSVAPVAVIGGPAEPGSPAAAAPIRPGQSLFRFASVLLGLSLPYVSCFLFTSGTDRLGRRLELWRLSLGHRLLTLRFERIEGRWSSLVDELSAQNMNASRVAGPQYLQGEIASASAVYAEAYAEAASGVLAGREPGSVFTTLRTIAIRRLLK